MIRGGGWPGRGGGMGTGRDVSVGGGDDSRRHHHRRRYCLSVIPSIIHRFLYSFVEKEKITFSTFFSDFWRTHAHVLFWGHWHPLFGFLVTSPLGLKVRKFSALFISQKQKQCTFPWDSSLVLHLQTSTVSWLLAKLLAYIYCCQQRSGSWGLRLPPDS